MINKIQKELNDTIVSDFKDKERELRKMKYRLTELDKLFGALCEDKVMENNHRTKLRIDV